MADTGKRTVPPTVMVIFGASGDLTSRKLVPALFNLSVDGLLPDKFFLIGYGRNEMSDDQFKALLKDSLIAHSRRQIDDAKWSKISPNISFHSGAYDNLESFEKLKQRIDEIQVSAGEPLQCIFYLSTPPSGFLPILENLGSSGLARLNHNTASASKVIVEKPFGRNLSSARELNHMINRRFSESQVYRIDHYLGKETVQSLLVQRFANSIFEPVWNRNYVSCIQITVAEDLGVGSRAGYYDRSGALRDMIQNHVMQLLALTAMEPPSSLNPEAIRDEKVKALQAVKPLSLNDINSEVVAEYTVKGWFREKKRSDTVMSAAYLPILQLKLTQPFVYS